MSEMLDYFDDKMNYLGTASRKEVHQKGYWHQTFHCWIIRNTGEEQYILFQRRGPEKKTFPNTLDITAAGHLAAGESKEDGLRELNEELGINAKYENLIYLGIRMSSARVGDKLNQEFAHVYLLESNIPLEQYKLQADEVGGLVQMKLQDGLDLFSGRIEKARITGYQIDDAGITNTVDTEITIGEVIPRIDPYYYKVFIMSERYFEGNKYLSI
ncbi:NUDIX hydrolase [Desulfospira joergensenii]|uniref:NUDIX hydrolase n=1 Tax=Desulfospira joergensenii TaxID=53329 RepID=UPI0003B69261|nr:NUDIX domain-containing protein [Desulfospira joergensenii]